MRLPGGVQLTYCTNIHPSAGMGEVRANLERYAVPLRARLSPDAPFGVGLRLSGPESAELLEGTALADFRSFLDERGLYVFTLNGFPYGPFHGQPVKAQVHAPDWRDEERVAYTLRLAEILAALLPEGEEGGISTSPLSYREWVGEEDWPTLTRNVVRVVAALVRLREERGRLIHLDLEPEPDGLLQCSSDLARFFTEQLLEGGARDLAAQLGSGLEQAREQLREHVQVCFDTCHVAVMYETPAAALRTYRAAGMRVGKVQISSALRLSLPADPEARLEVARALSPFAEATYLHQVVARGRDGSLRQYPDLPPALADLDDPDVQEWRVHFHVPVFLERAGVFGSTQREIVETFALMRERPFTRHLEIETYTWDVLPPELKRPLLESIEREYRWVQDVL
ncbi:metabolite traffic protein EboE [Deinococcus budaensis]|uniref:Sugar phosphate isomerase/epimerase n=1 Tax=Deinococcus budaensis TaxID=1665626 RepID=A0A7W8GE89_9DEIO|nr:metabolite traffic protein EboE [Deinococcus budaensis]MBB5233996.1 sugar phosphate isomerase/epimerase [Deinococcus budaensis]